MSDCIFCRLASDSKAHCYEDEFFYGMFDDFPVNPGHALLIPKRHVPDLKQLDVTEWEQLQRSIKQLTQVIENTDLQEYYQKLKVAKAENLNLVWFVDQALNHPGLNIKPAGYNHGVNEGVEAGQTVFHLHWHIIPRFEGDVDDPRGGVRYVIPDRGNYKIARA